MKIEITEKELEILISRYKHSLETLDKNNFPTAIKFLETRLKELQQRKNERNNK